MAAGGEQVPSSAARGLRVWGDHRDARLDQIIPVFDSLRVSFAHQKVDRGNVGTAIVGKPLLPVRRHKVPIRVQRVNVRRQGERYYICSQAIDYRPGLLSRAAVRLLDGDALSGLGLVGLGKCLIEFLVELAGRIAGDVQQFERFAPAGSDW